MELLPRGRVESAEDGKPCPEADFISQQVYYRIHAGESFAEVALFMNTANSNLKCTIT